MEPEYSRGERIGRRVMQLVALLWLGMLFAPVQELARADEIAVVLGGTGVAAFLAVYVWTWFRRFGQADANFGLIQRWSPFAVLLLLSAVLTFGFGPDWYPFFIFAGVAASITVSVWTAVWCIAGTTAVATLAGTLQDLSVQAVGLNALTIASVGAGTLMVNYVLRTARELRMARAELTQLAVANERLRFARDLHDLLGHSLSLIALKADLAEHLLRAKPDQALQEVRDVQRVTRGALKEVREAVAGYRQHSLVSELVSAREMLAAAGIGCHVEGNPAGLPGRVDATLAWVLREAVTNVIRHSRAHRCEIQLRVDDATARVEIRDDGTAVPMATDTSSGSGLAGLAERVAAVGGSCQAGPGSDGGFKVVAYVPLTASSEVQRS